MKRKEATIYIINEAADLIENFMYQGGNVQKEVWNQMCSCLLE